MVQIIDMTEGLNTKKDNEIILNPSIVKLNDNEFLISFRYLGYLEKTQHPWVGVHKDNMWSMDYGGTAFAKIILDKTNNGFNVKNIKHFDSRFENAEDARLFKRSTYKDINNFIYITYSINANFNDLPEELKQYYYEGSCDIKFDIENSSKYNKRYAKTLDISKDCNNITNDCGYMVICKCELLGDEMNLKNNYLICPKCIHQKIEKNWSLWESNDKNLRISYDIIGTHKFLIANTDDFQNCDMISFPNKLDLFEDPPSASVELYDLKAEMNTICSLSTPAVDFGDDIMLAVGHAKHDHKGQMKPEFKKFKDVKIHPYYHYFMFFYTFDKDTGKILEISQLFTPYDNEPYSLVFASGLCKFDENNFIVSYGVGDEYCKLAIFSKDEILGLLDKKKRINRDIKLLYPEKSGGKNRNINKNANKQQKIPAKKKIKFL